MAWLVQLPLITVSDSVTVWINRLLLLSWLDHTLLWTLVGVLHAVVWFLGDDHFWMNAFRWCSLLNVWFELGIGSFLGLGFLRHASRWVLLAHAEEITVGIFLHLFLLKVAYVARWVWVDLCKLAGVKRVGLWQSWQKVVNDVINGMIKPPFFDDWHEAHVQLVGKRPVIGVVNVIEELVRVHPPVVVLLQVDSAQLCLLLCKFLCQNFLSKEWNFLSSWSLCWVILGPFVLDLLLELLLSSFDIICSLVCPRNHRVRLWFRYLSHASCNLKKGLHIVFKTVYV